MFLILHLVYIYLYKHLWNDYVILYKTNTVFLLKARLNAPLQHLTIVIGTRYKLQFKPIPKSLYNRCLPIFLKIGVSVLPHDHKSRCHL